LGCLELKLKKPMATLYQQDVIAWANQQAALLRAGRFAELDVEQVAEEIEDVGKSEQRELANRIAVLLAHLLKWQFQPERQGRSWRQTITVQRRAIAKRLQRTPSLKSVFGRYAVVGRSMGGWRSFGNRRNRAGFSRRMPLVYRSGDG